MTPRTARQRDHRDHQQGAHGGQAETRQRAVQRGEPQRGQRLRLPPRQAQAEPRPQRIDHPHQPDASHRRHTDMEARNGDEMRSAVGARHFPIVRTQAARIADGEGAQQRGRADIGDAARDPVGDGVTPAVDAPRRAHALVGRTIAHITGGDDTALQRAALTIATARIDQSARPLEAQRQTPAPAGRNHRNDPVAAGVPGKPQPSIERDRRTAYRGLFHLQQKPRRFIALLRQAGHRADHDQIAPFQLARQARFHRPCATPCSPGRAKHQEGDRTRPWRTPGKPDRQDEQRHHPALRRQHRHPLHCQHAGKKCRRQPDDSKSAHCSDPSLGMAQVSAVKSEASPKAR